MVYFILGLWLITVGLGALYMKDNSKKLSDVDRQLRVTNDSYRAQYNLSQTNYDNHHKTYSELKTLAEKFEKLSADQLLRFNNWLNKLQAAEKNIEVMRIRQTSMDKKLAVPSEIIVSIKEPIKIAGPETKKLLKRAGVIK